MDYFDCHVIFPLCKTLMININIQNSYYVICHPDRFNLMFYLCSRVQKNSKVITFSKQELCKNYARPTNHF